MKIWEPTKCCCCCDVRTGCIVLGIILLVGSSFSLISGVQTLSSGDESDVLLICEDAPDQEACIRTYTRLQHGMGTSSIVSACFHIIFSSLLLYGVIKKKTTFFLPLMVVYVIQIVVMILVSAAVLILLMYIGAPFAATLLVAAVLGGIIFLETYCLLVIRAHYLQIKREKGHIHTALSEQDPEALPQSGPQVPPYPGSQVPPYPGSQVPSHPGNEVPPPYPGSNVPLCPNVEKVPL